MNHYRITICFDADLDASQETYDRVVAQVDDRTSVDMRQTGLTLKTFAMVCLASALIYGIFYWGWRHFWAFLS